MRLAAFMDESTETKPETKRAGGFAHWVYWFVVVVLLYVLSIGPVAGIRSRIKGFGKNGDKAIFIIYTPLRPLFAWAPLNVPFMLYIEWWEGVLAKKE